MNKCDLLGLSQWGLTPKGSMGKNLNFWRYKTKTKPIYTKNKTNKKRGERQREISPDLDVLHEILRCRNFTGITVNHCV